MRNPFFGNDEPSKLVRWLVLAGVMLVPFGIAALFIYAPFLRYNDVRIEGLTTLAPENITTVVNDVLDKKRVFIIPGRNIFLANEEKIVSLLDAQFNFASLDYQREGRTLVLYAEERISEIAWIAGEQLVLIDLQGLAVREASEEEKAMILARTQAAAEIPAAPGLQPTMPIIINTHADVVALGSNAIEREKVSGILTIDEHARSRGLQPLRYVIDEPTSPWVALETPTLSLYFDFNVPVNSAYVMFDAYQSEHPDLSNLLYIDLRFGNHLYIKEREV